MEGWLFPFKETCWAAHPDKTTSPDAQRRSSVVEKTQPQKAKYLDFICSCDTNFLDDCGQVNQVPSSSPRALSALAQVVHSLRALHESPAIAKLQRTTCCPADQGEGGWVSEATGSLTAEIRIQKWESVRAKHTLLNGPLQMVPKEENKVRVSGAGLPELGVVHVNSATLKGFLNLGAWVVQDELSGHIGIFSFLGAGLISSALRQTCWVTTQSFCSCCKEQPSHGCVSSHKEVMLPARELRLNALVFPHALEGKRSLERVIVVVCRNFASVIPCNNS